MPQISNYPIKCDFAPLRNIYVNEIVCSACIPIWMHMVAKVQHHAGQRRQLRPNFDNARLLGFGDERPQWLTSRTGQPICKNRFQNPAEQTDNGPRKWI